MYEQIDDLASRPRSKSIYKFKKSNKTGSGQKTPPLVDIDPYTHGVTLFPGDKAGWVQRLLLRPTLGNSFILFQVLYILCGVNLTIKICRFEGMHTKYK